ncbi:hypothetical protein LC085_20675 [Bacillus tianshenii]|uniref:hypothetical protein n=1 Tax=Sutcliffiella tianshenii TaxID=1463404 RepID=UPI001CD60A59|nr:hypothetical protein [Bacillus tianshenii]MCA1322296.1 hypothetical protein [Bacillus tianshenii]
MLMVFLSLLGILLVLYAKDHFSVSKSHQEHHHIPLGGILATGVVFYLLSRGLINEEQQVLLESMTLEELEGYILSNDILTPHQWADVCITEFDSCTLFDFDMDMPIL